MKPIIRNATIRGEIYPPRDLSFLTQDMLEVELPGGVFIDVGWYPEHDPNGEYGVIVFQDDPDNLLNEPYSTRDPSDAISAVQMLASIFSQPEQLVSGSTETTISPTPRRKFSYA